MLIVKIALKSYLIQLLTSLKILNLTLDNTMQIKVTKTLSNEKYSNRTSGAHFVFICLLNKIKDGEYTENGDRVGCKDYIGDSIAYQELGFPNGGSSPDKPIDKSRFCYSFLTHSKSSSNLLIKQSKLLNRLERDAGIQETKFYLESDKYVVIDADPFWHKSTLLTSIHIQIVRSLIYKTNRRNIYTHMQECITAYNGAKDNSYWRNIINSKVDFKFLFNNIDRIINGNPFTACNDSLIKDNISKGIKKDGNAIYSYEYESIKVITLDGVEHTTRYTRSCNHGCHGISNFSRNLELINKEGIGNAYSHGKDVLFASWPYNYWLLKNKKV